MDQSIVIVGYSGHSFEIIESLKRNKRSIHGYSERLKKSENPYSLDYLGDESINSTLEKFKDYEIIVSIGDNKLRNTVQEFLEGKRVTIATHIDSKSGVSDSVEVGAGTVILKGCSINAQTKIGKGVICNTNSIIEHECEIGDYVHIAPGVTICGNVKIGKGSLIGAGAVVLPNIEIGENVIIGANSMVNKNIPSSAKAVGNPVRIITEKF